MVDVKIRYYLMGVFIMELCGKGRWTALGSSLSVTDLITAVTSIKMPSVAMDNFFTAITNWPTTAPGKTISSMEVALILTKHPFERRARLTAQISIF
jgi:hypothetical protein